jgi:hypothetical protein
MIASDLTDLLKLYDEFAAAFLPRLQEIEDQLQALLSETKENVVETITDAELVSIYANLQTYYLSGPNFVVYQKLKTIRDIAFKASANRIHNDIEVTKGHKIKQAISLDMLSKLTPEERAILIKQLGG